MRKKIQIAVCVMLAVILLLSLPFLYVFINGAVIGSFESFPTQERREQARLGYVMVSGFLLCADIAVSFIMIRILMKHLTGKT